MKRSPYPLLPRSNSKGSILVMGALAVLVIVGCAALSVDVGLMTLNANRLQRACDASALAAVAKLKFNKSNFSIVNNASTTSTVTVTTASRTQAATEAVFVASQNGTLISAPDVVFPSLYKARVNATESTAMYFARIFGAANAGVTRHATAEMTPVSGINGAAPLGLTVDDYNLYGPTGTSAGLPFTVDLIVNQSDDFTPGDALALSLDSTPSKSVSEFKNTITNGTSDVKNVGTQVNSLNGTTSVQSAAYDGLASRLQSGRTRFPIMIIPPKAQTNGTSYPVGNIAFVELISVTAPKTGGKKAEPTTVTFKFLSNIAVSPENYAYNLASNPGPTDPVSDIYILRLVDDL
jgi:Flp pilus assembly protein TadG